ncbi:MAG: diguanylate cyclase [Planctomycetaceae bacterium]|nr:diguanylate cyclase [Planctomycetaceae bacterium]
MGPTTSARDCSLPTQLKAVGFTLLIGWFVWSMQPMANVDRIWSDVLLVCQEQPADRDIVVVQVTAADVLENGVDRLDRRFVARTLEKFAEFGARRVLSDINLNAQLSADEYTALLHAMKQLGPERFATGYEPNQQMQGRKELLNLATLVDLRMIPARDTRFREHRYPLGSPVADPIAWLAFGERTQSNTTYDLRVDPHSFQTYTISDLHQPLFPPANLRDKLVILAMDQSVNRTRIYLPITGESNRGTLLAMATHAKLHQYERRLAIGNIVQFVHAGSAVLAGLLIGLWSKSVRRAFLWFMAVGAVLMFGSSYMVVSNGTHAQPAGMLILTLSSLYSALAFRLKLPQLIWGFMSGDLSPEEAWAWRTQSEGKLPAVLFGSSGMIKRANQAAVQAFKLHAPSFAKDGVLLAKLCSPGVGDHAERITTNTDGEQTWTLTWPHGHLPLVVFNDITAAAREQAALKRQLTTDPLTKVLNRKGFEDAVEEINGQGRRDYAILFMDMNGFKQVNDEQGHEAGDLLLKHAAARFASAIRPTDRLARLGGDEFAVLMIGQLDRESVQSMALRLEATLVEPIDVGSAIVHVGVAAGFALPELPTETSTDVLRRADHEMYARKSYLKSLRGETPRNSR